MTKREVVLELKESLEKLEKMPQTVDVSPLQKRIKELCDLLDQFDAKGDK